MKPRQLNPIRLLSSVPFAIFLVVLMAGFISLAWARSWLGGWFDRTDAQYFNAWPLKGMVMLLVASLMGITWRRLPLTARCYGAWCVVAGTIILMGSLNLHLARSMDGYARIYFDPSVGPMTVDRFYDKDDRSLFIRVGQEVPVEIQLPGLPRFAEYDQTHASAFANRGLSGIEPGVESTDTATGQTRVENLAELIGCTGQKLKVDVVGFHPRATLSTEFVKDPTSSSTGVKLTTVDGVRWMVGSDARFRVDEDFSGAEIQHLDVDATSAAGVIEAAEKLSLPDARPKTDLHDPFHLLPLQKKVRHTFLTPPGGDELVDIAAGTNSTSISIRRFPAGVEDLASDPPAHIERQDHIGLVDNVAAMPPLKPDEHDSGSNQVVTLKVAMGDWSTILNVPFAEAAADRLSQDPWRGGFVKPPGAIAPLQIQLGNSTRSMPTSLTLLLSKGAVDPVFTFSITDPVSGASDIETAKLHHPIYFNSGKWVFTPTAYDAGGKWIQLQIENRPAVGLMLAGGSLVVIGAVYSVMVGLIVSRNK